MNSLRYPSAFNSVGRSVGRLSAFSKVLGLRLPWEAAADVDDPVARARENDERAIGALYAAHHEDLRGFCRRLVGDPQAAEDLVHDVFVELPRALKRYRGDASMVSFLRSIAINHARHHIRAAVRRRQAMSRLASELEHDAGFAPAEIERRQLARQLTSALDQLPLPQRIAFVLCEVEEMTAVEAAVVMDVPPATVRTRLFHAKQKLRELVGGES